MASNVFGNPITDETLKKMPEYAGKTIITRADRAHVALQMKNAQNKAAQARAYVENLKEQYGNGSSTLCLVYNSTGDTVVYATSYDWHGHIGSSPYPAMIANGQWGAFLHVHSTGASVGSSAAVVYHGADHQCDLLLAWSTPWSTTFYNNHCYTEIADYNFYVDRNLWSNDIENKLNNASRVASYSFKGFTSNEQIGIGTSAIFEAIISLEGAGFVIEDKDSH